MKKLSDFKDEKGIEIAAQVLSVIMDILAKKENKKPSEAKSPLAMFSAFMQNSPKEMMKVFAVLSEEDPEQYTCDGAQAMLNMLVLANDSILVSLFTSQGRTGDATSSGSVSENTEV